MESGKIENGLNKGVWRVMEGNFRDVSEVPILKNIGIAAEVPAEKIFIAFEEYFMMQKSNMERTESVGLTDVEKVTNHGFDAKTSFRGK